MQYYFKKNKIAIIISIILVLFSIALGAIFNNNSIFGSDLKIKEYKINLRINKDGSGSFNNYITYDFDDVDYTVIYEDIGFKKGTMFSYGDINNEEVILKENNYYDLSSFDYDSFVTKVYQNNEELSMTQIGYSFNGDIEMDTKEYVISPNSNQERIFCYYEPGYDEDTTFNFQYKINGLVSSYKDIGVINWILSPMTDISIRNLSVNITFEESLTSEQVSYLKDNVYIHGNVRYRDLNVNLNGVSFLVDKQTPNQLVELRMGFDNSLVSNISSQHTYNYNAMNVLKEVERLTTESFEAYNKRYFTIQTIMLILLLLLIALVAFGWYKAYIKYDKERESKFDSEYYRELPASYPPAELGYLYNFKDTTKDDLSATIMDLIRKKYITLDTNGQTTMEEKPNYIYYYNKDKNQSSLKSYERFVLDWYINRMGNGTCVSMEDIDDYLKVERKAKQYIEDNKIFINLVREESRKNKFFDSIRNLGFNFGWVYAPLLIYILFGFYVQVLNYYTYAVIFIFITIAIIILFNQYLATIKRRSTSGNEDYVRWRAFKNFLLEFGRFEDYTMPLIEIWEHYMVYAVSFGIAEEVEKQMRLKFKSMGEDKYEDYVASSPVCYHRSYYYVSRSCSSGETVARATIAQAAAARAASSGGGGSFGGGRSFGGGGGGHGGR